jgi:alpha-mannosidase
MITDYGFSMEKLEQRITELRAYLYSRSMPLPPFKHHVGEVAGGAIGGGADPNLDDSTWNDFSVGQSWGGSAQREWFRVEITLPDWFVPGDTCLRLVPGGDRAGGGLAGFETLVYLDGVETQAIDPRHLELQLPSDWMAGETHLMAIHAYPGANTRRTTWEIRQELDHNPEMNPNPPYMTQIWQRADLCLIDRTAERLYYDADTAWQAIELYDEDDPRRVHMLNALDDAFRRVDWRAPGDDAFRASVAEAAQYLRENLYEALKASDVPDVVGTGHAHIDVAWLWPLDVTREKTARTVATALHLMDQYPDYVFTQSQTQLYQFIKEDHPALYERVKQKIEAGQWAATGAMWVEADCNVSSGESLVRQILFGKRFFRQELGTTPRLLWLPDVFGYSAALPQILKRSGVDYFMTTKISWNQFNRLPVDTFYWEGLDGSEVLTHFITTPSGHSWWSTYNGRMTPHDIKSTWDLYHQKRINDELLTAYGYGDGGGGPTKDMLERAKRLEDMPGVPRVKLGDPESFFDRLAERIEGVAPKWVGELYLEYHRGTYTTQARNKRANRKSELLYRDAEFFAALSQALLHQPYPQEIINQGWELILLNQFHDIIPGSSINQVYVDSQAQYAEVRQRGNRVRAKALHALAEAIDGPAKDPSLVVFNSTSWPRSDWVRAAVPDDLPDTFELLDAKGQTVPYQQLDGDQPALGFEARQVPSLGWATYRVKPVTEAPEFASPLTITASEIDTPFWEITLNDAGQITSLWDKAAERQVIAEGQVANQFQAFEDKPLRFDAWDIDIFYQEKMWSADEPAEIEVVETGPVRGRLKVTREFMDSTISQYITVYANTPRIDFETEIDWQARQTLLKVAFPVAIHSSRATYEIQYGNVERPTHWNTSWDWARFETCAQKWVDLSEGGYGVSLLNDCKYGHDIRNNVMRLTLLKSPLAPDPKADLGTHTFTYSLYPHQGDWRKGAPEMAYGLNAPLLSVYREATEGELPESWSLVGVDRPGVIVETVKKAEEGQDLVIRVYECHNSRGPVTLDVGLPIAEAYECDLLEENPEPVIIDDNRISFEIAPYQIRTFGLRLS